MTVDTSAETLAYDLTLHMTKRGVFAFLDFLAGLAMTERERRAWWILDPGT